MKKIIKSASKILMLSLAIVSAKIGCEPGIYWVGKRAGKIVVIFVDTGVPASALPNVKTNSLLTEAVTPSLMKFIVDLSKITKSNFIIPLPLSEVKEVNEHFQRNLLKDKGCLTAILSFAINNPTFNNMTFKRYEHDELDRLNTVHDCIADIIACPGIEIRKSLSTINFSEYIKYLQESKNIFFKYLDEQNFKAETREYINKLESFDELLKDFEQNEIIKFFKSNRKDITLFNFLTLLDDKSERSERSELSLRKEELKSELESKNPINRSKVKDELKLIIGLEKIEINWLQTLFQMLKLNTHIAKLLRLKEIFISTTNKNLTICYLQGIETDILKILNLEFDTIDYICTPEKFIYPNEKMLKNIKANLSLPDSIKDYSSFEVSDLTTITSRFDLLPIYKHLIKKEIDENEHLLFIKDSLGLVTIEEILDHYSSLNMLLTKHKMTLLMLAAYAKPSVPRLVNLLLERGADPSIRIADNKINRDEIPLFIGFSALEFAKRLKSDDVVALLELSYESRLRLKELAKLNGRGDLLNKCGNCDKKPVSHCKQCKKLNYCSRECQLAHWEMHKKDCKILAKIIDLSIFSMPEGKTKVESSSSTDLPAVGRPDGIDEGDEKPNKKFGGPFGAAGSIERLELNKLLAQQQQALKESMTSLDSSTSIAVSSAAVTGGHLPRLSSVHTPGEDSKEVKNSEVALARPTAVALGIAAKEQPMKMSRSSSAKSARKTSLARPTAVAVTSASSAVAVAQSSAAAKPLAKLESKRTATTLRLPRSVAATPTTVAAPRVLTALSLSPKKPVRSTAVAGPQALSASKASTPTPVLPTAVSKPKPKLVAVAKPAKSVPVAAAAAAIAATSPTDVAETSSAAGKWINVVIKHPPQHVRKSRIRGPRTASQLARRIAANTVKPSDYSTGRTEPKNSVEDEAMQEVKLFPAKGVRLNIPLKDPRYQGKGWRKYRQIVNGVKIHYNGNVDGRFEDFKFKD